MGRWKADGGGIDLGIAASRMGTLKSYEVSSAQTPQRITNNSQEVLLER
jgi:hypothetical protein